MGIRISVFFSRLSNDLGKKLKMGRNISAKKLIVQTIGHSTRTLEQFSQLLKTHEVGKIIDIRTIPRSRRYPQFNRETLPEDLEKIKISYVHMPGLGGLRRPVEKSVNSGWHNASFRGFADYMQTPEFSSNLEQLIDLAKFDKIALMCAEAVPWRCHRSLIADALTIRGIQVEHILSLTSCSLHHLTPFARVEGVKITYPAENSDLSRSPSKIFIL